MIYSAWSLLHSPDLMLINLKWLRNDRSCFIVTLGWPSVTFLLCGCGPPQGVSALGLIKMAIYNIVLLSR